MNKVLTAGSVKIGAGQPLTLLAGPCVIENLDHTLKLANAMQEIAARVGVGYVFKASYDKANRTSVTSYRGPGIDEGLKILQKVKDETGLPILSDVHDVTQVSAAAEVLDIIQIPAFLSRQTDLLVAVGGADAKRLVDGAREAGFPDGLLHVVEDADRAAELLLRVLRSGDVVLVKGSRGVGLDRTVAALTREGVA